MILLVFFMYAMFALTFILGSASVHYASPIFFIGLRMALTSAVIFISLAIFRLNWRVPRRDWWLFGLLGVFHIFIPYVGENIVFKYLPAAQVSLMWNLSPLVTALFAWLLLRERMTFIKFIGLLVGFLGFIPTLVYEYLHEIGLRSVFLLSAADWLLLLAIVSAAAAWSLVRLLRQRGYGALIINVWSMLLGSVLSFIVSWFFEPWHPFPVSNWGMTMWCAGWLVLTGGILGYNLYGHLLKKYTATFLSFAGSITPFFTAFLAWFFLHDTLNPVFFFSTFITCIGLYLVYQQELRQGYIQQ